MYEESLKQYVNEDIVYKRYKSGETEFNDFEKFCIKHCKDIESLLEQNRILKSQLDFIDEQNKYIEKIKKRIDKTIEYINKYESIKAYYEYIDEDGYDEYNCDEDFKSELLDILKEVSEWIKKIYIL